MIRFLLEIPLNDQGNAAAGIFKEKPEIILHFSEPDFEFIAWGDPIPPAYFGQELKENRSIRFITANLPGHYYYLLSDSITGEICFGNSLFSILPVYYYISSSSIIVSDNALYLGRHLHLPGISRRFILETVLFNYPVFNHSAIEGISLLPANSYLSVKNGRVTITRHTSVADLFSSDPVPWKKSIGRMTDLFLESVRKYLPDHHYFSALTGGFDGRTLVAAGLYHKRSFSCYCFGSNTSRDLIIAADLAVAAGLDFMPVHLDKEYAENESLDCGKKIVTGSSGIATFARAHYIHSARQLAKTSKYLVTGNFGSELLRAVHVPGVIIAPNLISVFRAPEKGSAVRSIEQCREFDFLNRAEFSRDWEDLKNDIGLLPCFSPDYRGLTRNQQFYIFVLEEIFRKYFGAEMISQFSFIRNRTPFLDIGFIRGLFDTDFAGIHSDFFEHNPLRRYKGQVLYAEIINKAFPCLGKFKTDKGYSPSDLLSLTGKIRITGSYFRKQLSKGIKVADPYGVREAWKHNDMYFRHLPADKRLFNHVQLNSGNTGRPSDTHIRIHSLIYLDDFYRTSVNGTNG